MIEFLLLLYAASFFLSAFFPYEIILSFACAVAVHECGHMMSARLLSVGCSSPAVVGTDARIYLGYTGRILHELCILAAGPICNIMASVVSLLAFRSGLFLFSALSFAMGIINLLPIAHLDGGRMLYLYANTFPYNRLTVIIDALSLACSLSLVLFTSYRMLRFGDSFLSFTAVWGWFLRSLMKSENGHYSE